jgi:hypothetical protein
MIGFADFQRFSRNIQHKKKHFFENFNYRSHLSFSAGLVISYPEDYTYIKAIRCG